MSPCRCNAVSLKVCFVLKTLVTNSPTNSGQMSSQAINLLYVGHKTTHSFSIRARETFSGWPPFLSKREQRTLRVISDVGDSLSGWWRVCHFDTPSLCFRYCLCHDVRHRSELGRNWEVETLTALSPPLLAAAGKLEPVPSEAEAASSTEL